MAIDGTPKFSTLAVAEIGADFKGTSISLTAKAAFVHQASGATHGWTRGEGSIWSKRTMECLDELRRSMEEDLAAIHFSDHVVTNGTRAPVANVGGLGEFLTTRSEADQA